MQTRLGTQWIGCIAFLAWQLQPKFHLFYDNLQWTRDRTRCYRSSLSPQAGANGRIDLCPLCQEFRPQGIGMLPCCLNNRTSTLAEAVAFLACIPRYLAPFQAHISSTPNKVTLSFSQSLQENPRRVLQTRPLALSFPSLLINNPLSFFHWYNLSYRQGRRINHKNK
jgi:hypothetical protein